MATIDKTVASERTDLLPGSDQQSDKIRINWKRVVSHCIWFLLADSNPTLLSARSPNRRTWCWRCLSVPPSRSTRRCRPTNPTYWDGALARICSSSPMMLEERWHYSLKGLKAFISKKAEAVLVVCKVKSCERMSIIQTQDWKQSLTGQIVAR